MDFTIGFIIAFSKVVYLLLPVMLFFIILIIILGQIVGRIEGWTRFNSFYWSFITALTVGYGDIHPITKASRLLSLLVALLGIMFTGIIVAITITTATHAFRQHGDIKALQEIREGKLESQNISH